MRLLVALFTIILPPVVSVCPNDCNGNGVCTTDGTNRCQCYTGYTAPDCSDRTCPTGKVWFGYATETDGLHDQIAECSNAGYCNRVTGTCTCLTGFGGANCGVMPCPVDSSGNTCSGNGACLSMRQAAFGYDGVRLISPSTTYSQWDADRIFGCVCDNGFSGYLCDQRTCPKGDDPETTGQIPEIQSITCACPGVCSGSLSIQLFGKVKRVLASAVATTAEETGTLGSGSGPGESLESALRVLWPYPVTSSIMYSGGGSICTDGGNTATITFKHNLGNIAEIQVFDTNLVSSTSLPTLSASTVQDATTESVACSNRGVCDVSTGICACYGNYTASDGDGAAGSVPDCGFNEATPQCPTYGGLVCAGHGTCSVSTDYACVCNSGYTGVDCASRACPTGRAWFDEASAYNVAHAEAVCSNRGDCDGATGKCVCETGFTGAACDRTTCPYTSSGQACGGRGRCLNNRQLTALGRANGAVRGNAEVQRMECDVAVGTIQLEHRYYQTAALPYSATADQLRAALETIPNIGVISVHIRNGGVAICDASNPTTEITFHTLAGDVPMLSAVTSALVGSASFTEHVKGTLVTYGEDVTSASTWDAEMLYGCHCDGFPDYNKTAESGDTGAYRGVDCLQRTCPWGVDPVQALGSTTALTTETQRITCTSTSGWFQLRFRGHTTAQIDVAATLEELAEALQALSSVGVVEISADNTGVTTVCDSLQPGVSVTFQTELGDLPELAVADSELANGAISVATVVDGVGTPEECAGRGLCDSSTALCKCFKGFVSSNGVGSRGRRGDCGAESQSMLINVTPQG